MDPQAAVRTQVINTAELPYRALQPVRAPVAHERQLSAVAGVVCAVAVLTAAWIVLTAPGVQVPPLGAERAALELGAPPPVDEIGIVGIAEPADSSTATQAEPTAPAPTSSAVATPELGGGAPTSLSPAPRGGSTTPVALTSTTQRPTVSSAPSSSHPPAPTTTRAESTTTTRSEPTSTTGPNTTPFPTTTRPSTTAGPTTTPPTTQPPTTTEVTVQPTPPPPPPPTTFTITTLPADQ